MIPEVCELECPNNALRGHARARSIPAVCRNHTDFVRIHSARTTRHQRHRSAGTVPQPVNPGPVPVLYCDGLDLFREKAISGVFEGAHQVRSTGLARLIQ